MPPVFATDLSYTTLLLLPFTSTAQSVSPVGLSRRTSILPLPFAFARNTSCLSVSGASELSASPPVIPKNLIMSSLLLYLNIALSQEYTSSLSEKPFQIFLRPSAHSLVLVSSLEISNVYFPFTVMLSRLKVIFASSYALKYPRFITLSVSPKSTFIVYLPLPSTFTFPDISSLSLAAAYIVTVVGLSTSVTVIL